ncbi:MAG: TolC family protein [Gammaproteobacteria bacterium]
MTHGHKFVAPLSPGSPRRHTRPLWLLAGLLSCWPAFSGTNALTAADPSTPVAPVEPLTWPSVPIETGPGPGTERSRALAAWQRANDRVAEFPRGHVDLLKWEARQPASAAASPAQRHAPLTLAEALQRSLALRPGLVAGPDAVPMQQTRLQSQWADHVRQVQAAWLAAVLARERQRIAADVLDNARVGAELGRRMVEAGNWSQARHLREQLIETRARQAWMIAGLALRVQTEQLARLIGVWDNAEIRQLVDRLPDQLPAVPPQVPQQPDAQAQALARWPGLDSQRARLGTVGSLPGLGDWDAAVEQAGQQFKNPVPESTAPAPTLQDRRLFNNHRIPEVARERGALLAEATLRRSQVREAEAAMQAYHALARLAQDELLVRQRIAEQETLLRYNGMLVSTWDLLAAARDRLSALDEASTARLVYWQAEADWRSLIAGGRYAGTQAVTGGDKGKLSAEGH